MRVIEIVPGKSWNSGKMEWLRKRFWKVMEFEELKRVQTLCNYKLDSLKDSEEKLLMGC